MEVMNNSDLQYQRLLALILEKGKVKKNRTGVNTIGVFGAQARFNLAEGFPLLTTKKVNHKAIVYELLWFLKGDTNIKYLVDNDCNIWNSDAYRKYKEKMSANHALGFASKDTFIQRIKGDTEYAKVWGELGTGTYGSMWRAFPYFEFVEQADGYGMNPDGSKYFIQRGVEKTVDQISKVIETLKTDPDSRRIIVNSWHPYWVDHCTLPPCHVLFHFNTEELLISERIAAAKKQGKEYKTLNFQSGDKAIHEGLDKLGIPRSNLNLQMYQRFLDLPIGGAINRY